MNTSCEPTLSDRETFWKTFFEKFPDWESKYKAIIELGKKAQGYPSDKKTDDWKVAGCQSQVWIWSFWDSDKKIQFRSDSDALITKGLSALICEFYSGLEPKLVLQHSPQFFKDLGLLQGLSANRAGGFMNMIKTVKNHALVWEVKQNSVDH